MAWTYVAMRPSPAQAIAHGHLLAQVQARMDLTWLQTAAITAGHALGLNWLSWLYYWSQLLGTWVAIGLLAVLSRPAYRLVRNLVFLVWCQAVVVFALWPAASPAMTVAGVTGAPPHPGYDVYAAMPSLHVATAVCVALAVRGTGWRFAWLAWLWPAVMAFVVLATANHYVLDVLAGCAISWLAYRGDRLCARAFSS